MKLWFVCFVAGRIWHETKPQVKSEFRSIRPWGEIRVSWPGSRAAPRTQRATFLESKAQWGGEKTAFFLIWGWISRLPSPAPPCALYGWCALGCHSACSNRCVLPGVWSYINWGNSSQVSIYCPLLPRRVPSPLCFCLGEVQKCSLSRTLLSLTSCSRTRSPHLLSCA